MKLQILLVSLLSLTEKPQFIFDAGNRFTYRYFQDEAGVWHCEGGHLWGSGRPSVPASHQIYWNPNTGASNGQWFEINPCFQFDPKVPCETGAWGKAVWTALQNQIAATDWTPTIGDIEVYRQWLIEKGELIINTLGLGCLYHLLGGNATEDDLDAAIQKGVWPAIPHPKMVVGAEPVTA